MKPAAAAPQAWIVTVSMGYGHQRAAYPLRDIACERIVTANSDKVVEPDERRRWKRMQSLYEGISRIRSIPFIGPFLWALYDRLQRIASFYPLRDLSHSTFTVRYLDKLVRKGFGRGIVDYAKTRDIPFLSTFFVPSLAAAHAGLRDIYCIVTDVDINRIWVARRPAESPIVYLAPTDISRMRLLQYGVPEEKVILTGFPLPEENLATVKEDLRRRLVRLDPHQQFVSRYRETIVASVGDIGDAGGPVTITYAVGGAGAQRGVAARILHGLASGIRDGRYHLNLIAGTRLEVRSFFMDTIRKEGLTDFIGKGVRVQCALDIRSYFKQFNEILSETDILWTKPSELVFYTGLGVPLIMTKPLGAHEDANRDWVQKMGAGFTQEDPCYAGEWLTHWIERGILAQAAFDAYSKAPRDGTANVKRILFGTAKDAER